MDSSENKPRRSLLDRYKTFVTDLGDQVEQESALKEQAQEDLAVANERLRKQVELFRKFVPETLTRIMDREDFDVSQGLSQEEPYSVLSCDIRDFTTFSESVSCTDVFRFLSSYFSVMEPGIRDFGGFV